MRDSLSNRQAVLLGTITLSGTTPGASAWLDTRGFDSAKIVLITDTVTDAGDANGFTVTVQHSDTTAAADAANIAAADSVNGAISLTVTDDAADNTLVGAIGYIGSRRYVRARGVGTTGTNATFKAYAVLGAPSRAPSAFVGTAVAAT